MKITMSTAEIDSYVDFQVELVRQLDLDNAEKSGVIDSFTKVKESYRSNFTSGPVSQTYDTVVNEVTFTIDPKMLLNVMAVYRRHMKLFSMVANAAIKISDIISALVPGLKSSFMSFVEDMDDEMEKLVICESDLGEKDVTH